MWHRYGPTLSRASSARSGSTSLRTRSRSRRSPLALWRSAITHGCRFRRASAARSIWPGGRGGSRRRGSRECCPTLSGRTSRTEVDGLQQLGHYANLAARFAEFCVAHDDQVGLIAFADRALATIKPARGVEAVTRIRAAL